MNAARGSATGLYAMALCNGTEGLSLHDAAIRMREQNRLVGRPLPRRAVGSTLLLKGLEGDIAVVLNAAALDARNLYVAMTRGSKGLTICSPTPVLNPGVSKVSIGCSCDMAVHVEEDAVAVLLPVGVGRQFADLQQLGGAEQKQRLGVGDPFAAVDLASYGRKRNHSVLSFPSPQGR